MLKIGLFGAGHLGKFHLNNWKEIEGVEIVGFYDPNERTSKAIIEKYQIKRFLNAEDLMALCDAADIVAPKTNVQQYG
jgi:predicted dehydrogenase